MRKRKRSNVSAKRPSLDEMVFLVRGLSDEAFATLMDAWSLQSLAAARVLDRDLQSRCRELFEAAERQADNIKARLLEEHGSRLRICGAESICRFFRKQSTRFEERLLRLVDGDWQLLVANEVARAKRYATSVLALFKLCVGQPVPVSPGQHGVLTGFSPTGCPQVDGADSTQERIVCGWSVRWSTKSKCRSYCLDSIHVLDPAVFLLCREAFGDVGVLVVHYVGLCALSCCYYEKAPRQGHASPQPASAQAAHTQTRHNDGGREPEAATRVSLFALDEHPN